MDLHNHLCLERTFSKASVKSEHRAFDNVCRRALHGRVNGRSLRRLSPRYIARVDFGKIQPPAKSSFDKPIFRCPGPYLVHVVSDARVAVEISVDVLLCDVTRDAKLSP